MTDLSSLSLLSLNILSMASIYVIIVLSLNLEFGHLGVPNFGKMLGVAVGALFTAWFSSRFAVFLYNMMNPSNQLIVKDYVMQNSFIVSQVNAWLSGEPLASWLLFFVTVALSTLVGGIIGLVTVYPSVKLKEDYLGITLLAMAEAVRIIGYNYTPIAGGTNGMQLPDPFVNFGTSRYSFYAVLLLAFAAFVSLIYAKMLKSPLGRTLKAIRENEESANSIGKNITAYRLRAMFFGTSTAALAGSLYAFYTINVVATAFDRVTWTFWPWVMLLLGGLGSNLGAIVGTFVFVILRALIIFYKQQLTAFVPFDVIWLDYLLLSIAIISVLMLKPKGILPEKPIIIIRPGGGNTGLLPALKDKDSL